MNNAILEQLSQLGLHFGPFFFSILFLIYINQRLYKNWDDSAGSAREHTLRWVYVASIAFSLVLVLIAVVWWLIQMPPMRTFQGKIVGLSQTQALWSDTLYFKDVHRPPWQSPSSLGEGTIERVRSEEFLVARKRNLPFTEDHHFSLVFRGSDGNETDLRLRYCDGSQPEYRIIQSLEDGPIIDTETCALPQESEADDQTAFWLPSLWPIANAAEAIDLPIAAEPSSLLASPTVKQNIVSALQTERTDTPTKSQLLTYIAQDEALLKRYLAEVTDKEPFVLTLLDLTRHTDGSLSSKADALLADFDLALYLTTLLNSKQYDGESLVHEILAARRDVDTPKIAHDELLAPLLAKTERRTLVPTASPQGDRYYVRASWPTDETRVETEACLTRAFNEELITTRTLNQEAALMSTLQANRLVYWYSKEWAEYMAGRITECGAVASFTAGTAPSN